MNIMVIILDYLALIAVANVNSAVDFKNKCNKTLKAFITKDAGHTTNIKTLIQLNIHVQKKK